MEPRDLVALVCGMALCWVAQKLDDRFRRTMVEWDALMRRVGRRGRRTSR